MLRVAPFHRPARVNHLVDSGKSKLCFARSANANSFSPSSFSIKISSSLHSDEMTDQIVQVSKEVRFRGWDKNREIRREGFSRQTTCNFSRFRDMMYFTYVKRNINYTTRYVHYIRRTNQLNGSVIFWCTKKHPRIKLQYFKRRMWRWKYFFFFNEYVYLWDLKVVVISLRLTYIPFWNNRINT